MAIERSSVPKQRLAAALPDEGSIGTTRYVAVGDGLRFEASIGADDAARLGEIAAGSDTGAVLFEHAEGATLVLPPFPIPDTDFYNEIYARPLLRVLDEPRVYAVFLLRLGGFAVGFFRGTSLIDSKVDQRFVKGKHRKGGQSSTRFARIREKQVHELFGKACETAHEKLAPYEAEVEHVFFGGDRRTLQAFRKECSYFDRFGDRLRERILPAHGDPRLVMLEGTPRDVWSCDVYVSTPEPRSEAGSG
jgi:hypothetical protein